MRSQTVQDSLKPKPEQPSKFKFKVPKGAPQIAALILVLLIQQPCLGWFLLNSYPRWTLIWQCD